MRYLLYCALSLVLFTGCKESNNELFGETPASESLSFVPAAGGAVLYYTLPKSDDIYSINVKYKDETGKETIVSGSHFIDSLLITGFNEAVSNVPAEVYYTNRDHIPSETIAATFSTNDSGAIMFFENLEVKAHWYGFKISYKGVPNSRAQAHVFYKGSNPLTGEPEDVLLEEFVVSDFDEIRYYALEKGGDVNDIIIKTEDFYGYSAKKVEFDAVPSYKSEMLAYDNGEDGGDYLFLDPFGLSLEEPEYFIGLSYLFDGDAKGYKAFGIDTYKYYTFTTGTFALSSEDEMNTAEHKYFVFDLKEPRQIASIRLHSMLDVRYYTYFDWAPHISANWGLNEYPSRLPSHVKVYVTNDEGEDHASKNWICIEDAEYRQEPDIDVYSRWCAASPDSGLPAQPYKIIDLASLDAAEPIYLPLEFDASLPKYRYVRFDVIDTYDMYSDYYKDYYEKNDNKQFTLNEIEVFVKAE